MNEPSSKQSSMTGAGETRSQSAAPLSRPTRLGLESRRVWAIFCLGIKKFSRIDGAQWAGAFAFNAFFSLFPLILLLVALASFFVDRDRAGKAVIAHVESYVPISGDLQRQIFGAVAGVIKARKQAGVVALLVLVWPALQCFTSLICATNRAWGTAVGNWWRLPLKSLVLLGITAGAALLGMAAPVLARMADGQLFPEHDLRFWLYGPGISLIPVLVLFFSLSLFYKLAPRQPTRFAQVWAPALCATILLRACESLFVIYLAHFATLNAVYGALGGIMALLLWIYLSGCVFVFGACLCAGRAEALGQPAMAPVPDNATTAYEPMRPKATRSSE
jgi:Ca2+-transporting ATPase